MTAGQERPRAGAAFPWPGALVALAVAGISAAGLGGLWAPWGERWIGTPVGSLLLVLFSLGPLAFYALALERGKPAPG
jgi:hypothetical protein